MAFLRRRKLTPSEQVDRSIDALERSNHFIVRAAHTFAFLLIIATSIASLIALAGDVVKQVSQHGGDVPTDASIAITLLLVMAMDTGMILAATMIRIGTQRGYGPRKLWGHAVIMLVVALLEAGTYTYMLALYEHPQNGVSWALIIARGVAVPLLSIYLSMAQRITVNTDDIARLIEVFSGVGLLKDLARDANDPDAPLDHKIAVYRAAATLSPAQRAKLDAMYVAVSGHPMPRIVDAALVAPDEIAAPDLLETSSEIIMQTEAAPRPADRPHVKPKRTAAKKPTRKPKATTTPEDIEAQVFGYLDQHPTASVSVLVEQLGVARGTASTYKRMWTKHRQAARGTAGPDATTKSKRRPPEPETIADAMVEAVMEHAREWLAAHPTATAEDVMKETGLDLETVQELLATAR